MKQPVHYMGVGIMRETSPCCNHCRFCSAGQKTFHNIPFDRYERIVERFLTWKAEKSLDNFLISPIQMYTYATMPVKQLVRRFRLCERGGYTPLPLQMNGLIFMPEDQLRDCLQEKKEAGFTKICLSFAGMGNFHDTWVGRRGEYKFLLAIAKIAADIGLERLEKLFLTQSTIPQLEPLMDVLNDIPGTVERQILPLVYFGWAKNLENERITQEMLEQLPEQISKYAMVENLKTEQQWIYLLRNGYQDESLNNKHLMLKLREDNIDKLEEGSCDEIITGLKAKYDRVHTALPEMREMAGMYGESSNLRLYMLSELEKKWTERYLKDNPQINMADYLLD
jgi:hypothetical protein